jgi:hypothetical protein
MKGKTFLLHICENFKKRCLTLEGTELVGAGNKTNGFNTTMVSMPSPAPEFQVLETYFSKSCGFFFFFFFVALRFTYHLSHPLALLL